MTINALVAVHPDIDPQFDDAQIMGQLPYSTQQAIESARSLGHGAFKTLQHNSRGYYVYSVYGSRRDLETTITQFGADNIIPLGSWNADGTRYGTQVVRTVSVNRDTFEVTITETLEGTPSIPLHPALITIMPDDVMYDSNGSEISRTPASELKQVILKCGQIPRGFV